MQKSRYVASKNIFPSGWCREFLKRQEEGLTGHPEESGFPFNGGMWTEKMDVRMRENPQFGDDWWPYEQTAYYLDGALRCGYMTGSKKLISRVQENLYYVVENSAGSGRLRAGNIQNDSWPLAVFMRALLHEYENTGGKELLSAVEKHYRTVYSCDESFDFSGKTKGFLVRTALHVEHLCRLHVKTGEKWYLTAAEKLYGNFCRLMERREKSANPSLTEQGMRAGIAPAGHAVTYHEFLKLPALLFMCTGKSFYREALENAYSLLDGHHVLASGLPSGTESLSGKSPLHAHEVCNAVEFNWSSGWALLATGDASYADKMEKVLYNAGFSSVTDDFRAHQYYSAPNMPVSCDVSSSWNDGSSWGFYAKGRLCYRPGHDTECCSGNIHRLFPAFLNRMCIVGYDSVSVVFYLPAVIRLPLSSGSLCLSMETDYPFDHRVLLRTREAPEKEISLKMRVPCWADSYKIRLNGKFVLSGEKRCFFAEIKRKFSPGDVIEISFSSRPFIERRGAGMAVNYGPLVFSLPVPENRRLTTSDGAGKCSPDYPAYQLFPSSPDCWQYALPRGLTPDCIKVINSDRGGYPWACGKSPVKLGVLARKVKNWNLKGLFQLDDFPENLQLGGEVFLELEPMGATGLRMTEFPAGEF